MADADRVDRIGHASAAAGLSDDAVLRNHPGSEVIDLAHEFELKDVARRFPCIRGGPPLNRVIEAAAGPPFRVTAGEVKRRLVGAHRGFADTIRGHTSTLYVGFASFKER